MIVTPTDVEVLRALARYYVMTRAQIQRVVFPQHADGRATRKRLGRLIHAGYARKHEVRVATPHGNAAPAYYPSKRGNEFLTSYFDDEQYRHCNADRPRSDRLFHWLAITETHIAVDGAVARDNTVSLDAWFNEWETVNKADAPDRHYVLHTVLRRTPPLSCSPDAAFVLTIAGHSKVFYLEQDRATSHEKKIAVSKTPGYAELHRQQRHRKHFPETTLPDFTILFVTTDHARRRAVAREIAKQQRPDLWLFLVQEELTAASLLHEPITYNHLGIAAPIIRRETQSDDETP